MRLAVRGVCAQLLGGYTHNRQQGCSTVSGTGEAAKQRAAHARRAVHAAACKGRSRTAAASQPPSSQRQTAHRAHGGRTPITVAPAAVCCPHSPQRTPTPARRDWQGLGLFSASALSFTTSWADASITFEGKTMGQHAWYL